MKEALSVKLASMGRGDENGRNIWEKFEIERGRQDLVQIPKPLVPGMRTCMSSESPTANYMAYIEGLEINRVQSHS
jgi:hypothetical protein